MQRVLLTFLIFFHSISSFAQINVTVEIKGITDELAENVRLYLSIEQQKGHTLLSEGRLRRLHQKASQEISKALQPFGYYQPVIKTDLTQPTTDHWLATYIIDMGPPLPVGQFNFTISEEMQNDPEFKSFIQNPPFRKGGVFSHVVYEKFKAQLARLAAERGYFNARFVKHLVEIDLSVYEARIDLHYDGGARYRFGEVVIQQNVLDPELLQRYIPFGKGSPYTLYELIELQQALNDSDYFRIVEVSPGKPKHDTAEVPVTVMLTPRKRHRYSLGLGYGTNTGMRTKFGWGVSPLNKRGHRLDTEAKISEIGHSISTHYRVPARKPRTDQIIYSAGLINEITDTSDSTVRTIGVRLNRNRSSWRESVYLNYQQEEFIIANDRGETNLLIPGINWSRIWGRTRIYSIEGLRFDINMRGASKELISDIDFFQLQSGIKAINPLGRHNRIIASGRLGTTWTQEFNQLPSSVRFFAGGSQSVRGYAYQSLGPVDESGLIVGGKHLILGSIEFEHSINNKWGVALFYDSGNAVDNFDDKLERGAGFGIRWKSPVGPVRIDLASAISREGQPWRIHINIGPEL